MTSTATMRKVKRLAHPLVGYAAAVIATLAALIMSQIMRELGSQSIFIFFWPAVVISAWNGRFGAGLLATFLSVFYAYFIVGSPDTALSVEYFLFTVLALLITWMITTRHEYDTMLDQTRAQMEIIMKGVADGITAIDGKGTLVFANPAAAQLMRMPSAEAMLQTPMSDYGEFMDLQDEDGQPIGLERLPQYATFQHGVSSDLTFQMRSKGSEEVVWTNMRSSPVFDENGDVVLAVSVFRDITDRKRREAQLTSERENLRSLINNVSVAIALLNPDGVVTEINETALQLVGMQSDELVGKVLASAYPWATLQETPAQIRSAVQRAADGENVRFDLQVRTANKTAAVLDTTFRPIMNAQGKVTQIVVTAADISQRKRAESELVRLTIALEAQRQRLKNIIANVPGLIWEGVGRPDDHPAGQRMEFVSDYSVPMLGYTPDELLNEDGVWKRIVYEEDWEAVTAQTTHIFEHEKHGRVEFRAVSKDGRIIPIEAQTTVIRDKEGRPVGACGVMMDISERKQAQEALEQYARELRRSNEELQQFAYVASHDLQEPLRMVASYLQLLERRYKDQLDQDANEFIGFAVDGATRMKALINDLLMYSRVQRKSKSFEKTSTGVIVEKALANLQISIEDTGAVITHDPLPEICCDENQIVQLFQNLISNAIKFRQDLPPNIHIGVERSNGDWVFAVRDNGIGIDTQYLDRIFVIFQRLHNKSQYPGTGIGLAICKRVVDNHGGRIWVESQVGQGSTFYFTIPANAGGGENVYGVHRNTSR